MQSDSAVPRWVFILLVVLMGAGLGVLSWRTTHQHQGEPVARHSSTSALPQAEERPAVISTSTRTSSAALSPPGLPLLFDFVRPDTAATLDQALPAPARAIHYVRVNRALFTGKQSPFWQRPGAGRLVIPVPDGGAATVVIDGSEMLGPDRFTSTGRIEDRPNSRALFAWSDGFLHASIEDPFHGSFALRTATSDLSQWYQVDPAQVPPCGGARRPDRSFAAPRLSGIFDSVAPMPPPLAAADNPQRAEVHLMMLYTPSVLTTVAAAQRPAAVQSAFDLAIAKVNRAFEASLISARVKLVRIAETFYDETASGSAQVQDDALTALYHESDGRMDEVHAWRDAAGADVVCLAVGRNDAASSGLSFLLSAANDPFNARFAFSVVQYSNVAGTHVVAHELGHVFGCAHDRENALSGAGAFSFSHGHRFFGRDGRQYHDIMAYPPGTELGYFSNPDIILPAPVSAPIGIPVGQPGESNNALTIERTAFATAGYRLQTQAAASAGRLINVATRAFVGTGEDVMIGGFVIQGAQPKRMLIRAAGPALRPFGVEDALADPVLSVFAGGMVAAENDNWAQPIGPGIPALAAEIVTAAAQVSAFGFAPGSADAAVLVTLPPGAYTAVVEGTGGASGHGLVEAYEMDRNTSRIVNLATRAFAGREGRELVGGFVVEGGAGTTKRILIRVLGPTLSRAPFNMTGTLEDPEMEVHNAAGDVLIRNDDWSSGASPGNDFDPRVGLYGEQQIFATGLAPANRREPCVLVDLPTGNYTVIVRPYEFRSSDPVRNQPAAPGVGVVEVYEIVQ